MNEKKTERIRGLGTGDRAVDSDHREPGFEFCYQLFELGNYLLTKIKKNMSGSTIFNQSAFDVS